MTDLKQYPRRPDDETYIAISSGRLSSALWLEHSQYIFGAEHIDPAPSCQKNTGDKNENQDR